jgi:hypothetical protein
MGIIFPNPDVGRLGGVDVDHPSGRIYHVHSLGASFTVGLILDRRIIRFSIHGRPIRVISILRAGLEHSLIFGRKITKFDNGDGHTIQPYRFRLKRGGNGLQRLGVGSREALDRNRVGTDRKRPVRRRRRRGGRDSRTNRRWKGDWSFESGGYRWRARPDPKRRGSFLHHQSTRRGGPVRFHDSGRSFRDFHLGGNQNFRGRGDGAVVFLHGNVCHVLIGWEDRGAGGVVSIVHGAREDGHRGFYVGLRIGVHGFEARNTVHRLRLIVQNDEFWDDGRPGVGFLDINGGRWCSSGGGRERVGTNIPRRGRSSNQIGSNRNQSGFWSVGSGCAGHRTSRRDGTRRSFSDLSRSKSDRNRAVKMDASPKGIQPIERLRQRRLFGRRS